MPLTALGGGEAEVQTEAELVSNDRALPTSAGWKGRAAGGAHGPLGDGLGGEGLIAFLGHTLRPLSHPGGSPPVWPPVCQDLGLL